MLGLSDAGGGTAPAKVYSATKYKAKRQHATRNACAITVVNCPQSWGLRWTCKICEPQKPKCESSQQAKTWITYNANWSQPGLQNTACKSLQRRALVRNMKIVEMSPRSGRHLSPAKVCQATTRYCSRNCANAIPGLSFQAPSTVHLRWRFHGWSALYF